MKFSVDFSKSVGTVFFLTRNNNNNRTFLSASLLKSSISNVNVSTQHRTETTNLSSMLRPAIIIIEIDPNINPVNQSVAVQVILKGKKMSFKLFSKNKELELRMCSGSVFKIIGVAKENERSPETFLANLGNPAWPC